MRHVNVTHLALLCLVALLHAASSPATEPLTWSVEGTPARFVAVHGRQSAIFGYSEHGLEVWGYPLQLVDAFNVAFRPQDATTETDGRRVLRRIDYRPDSVTRIYVGPDYVVREKLFVPIDAAGAIVTYPVEGRHRVDIVVRFTPVLNLMWPGGIGGQETAWNAAASGYLLSEPLHRYAALVSSPNIVAYDDTRNTTRQVDDSRAIAFTIRPGSDRVATVVVAADLSGADPIPLARKLLSDRSELEGSATEHYEDVLTHGLQIETPDPEVDRALTWAQLALEQAWVCNPDLGCGQVAGYGPSRKARRPQYDWFFAGDGMVTARALLAAGRYERAREELELILKFQDRKTGMIWHELSQSAGVIDWRKYPYMFVHVELSYDFLDIVADYYSVTGDLQFVKKNWAAIEGAYRYGQTLLDSKDGLPRIPPDKQGANEQDALSDELTLTASWIAASEAYAALASAAGRGAAARSALDANKRARQAVSARYWDDNRRFWISGHTRAGAPVIDRDTRAMGVVRLGLFSADQRAVALDQIASSDFQTDWGTRSKSSTDPTYDPNLYASGSVWALGTAGVASALWADHRPATALPVWSALVPWSSLDSPGHMHEVLAGDFYHEELESVPEQTWSSAAFLSAAADGLLGLRVDGVARQLSFSPHLPATWDTVSLRHIRVRDSTVTLALTRAAGELKLRIENDSAPLKMSFEPELPLGGKIRTARIGERDVAASIEEQPQDTHARVEFDLPSGVTVLRIEHSGGVAIVAPVPRPVIGEVSRAMKIVGVNLKDRIYTIEIDHAIAEPTYFELRTPWKIDSAQGAEVQTLTPTSYRLTIATAPAAGKETYKRSKVLVKFGGGE
jgi:hypothetical protein